MMWLDRKNEVFSLLCGESFTNKEVIAMHIYIVSVMLVCCFAEWLSK